MAAKCYRWFAEGIVFASFVSNVLVVAQETSATCILASLQWSFNSQKESPCVIASTLLGACGGGDYHVPALPDQQSDYLGPSIDMATPCQCNTVVYSLMSACSLCQNGTVGTWSEWTTNCATVFTSYPQPIPDELHVPAYAYLDVKTSDSFDVNAAEQDANATESTAVPTPSSTSTSATPTISTTSSVTPTATSTLSSAAGDLKATQDHSNVVGGAAVGAVLGLACLGGLTAYAIVFRRRRLRKATSAEDAAGTSGPYLHSLAQDGASPTNTVDTSEKSERALPNVSTVSNASANPR